MKITGMDTQQGRDAEAAYRKANRATVCESCDGIGRAFCFCRCESFLIPACKPLQLTLPTWC